MPHHRQPPAPVASLVLLLLTVGLSAQRPLHPVPAAAAEAATALRDPWRVPIHQQPTGSDALPGEQGWWAYGATFKASFRDGLTFHPVLGPGHPENLPWRWTTESVTAGGAPILAPATPPAHAHTDWRYEFRWPGMTEAYEVREDGVEQSFVFTQAPRGRGDLVVTGRIETRLRLRTAVPPAGAHGPLTFTDAQDRPIVQYGAAVAFDAAGRRTEVATAWDAGRITLTVPGVWLAQATWPVTIDPLTSSVAIQAGGAALGEVVVEHEHESARFNTMVFFTRASSATQYDGVALLCDDDFQNSVPVLTRALFPSIGQIDVAFVAAGSDTFDVVLTGPPAGTPCVLFFSFAPAAIPLGGAGMPGCVLHVDPSTSLLAFPSFVLGNASVVIPLPDRPLFTGDLRFQWLFLQLGLNPAGLGATQGLLAQVR